MRSSPPPPLLTRDSSETTVPYLDLPSEQAGNITRKRRFSFTDAPSSDPIFSDELSDAELTGDTHRRKRTIKCPWWELRARKLLAVEPQHALREKKQRFRGVDSGVWMGSDEDLAVTDSLPISSMHDVPILATDPVGLASSTIQQCLEEGREVVDLSNYRLEELPYETIQPLEHLIPRAITDCDRAPMEGEYVSLKPELQLYLSGNSLSTLPRELCRLPISVLSLRNNRLTGLPSNLESLEALKELNVAGNQLRYLPWSLRTWIGTVRELNLTIRPNPFLSLTSLQHDEVDLIRSSLTRKLSSYPKLVPRPLHSVYMPRLLEHLVSSQVVYYDVAGRQASSDTQAGQGYAPSLRIQPQSQLEGNTTVPSLFELALRKVQASQLPNDVTALIPDNAPSAVSIAVQTAARNQHAGNDKCSVCGRAMIIARAEWVEYWFWESREAELDDNSVVPFLRRACTIKCAKPTKSIIQWAGSLTKDDAIKDAG